MKRRSFTSGIFVADNSRCACRTLFILLGFVYGLSIRNPLKGVLIGVGVGAVFAIAIWLIDLRRRGR